MGKVMRFRLERVHYMPSNLKNGVLYYSEEYYTAAHLCACGCGSKIRTPIGPLDWTITNSDNGPTLSPSIGNWQKECQSHYFIRNGQVVWASKWTPEQIENGKLIEEKRKQEYYAEFNRNNTILKRFISWFKSLFLK